MVLLLERWCAVGVVFCVCVCVFPSAVGWLVGPAIVIIFYQKPVPAVACYVTLGRSLSPTARPHFISVPTALAHFTFIQGGRHAHVASHRDFY